MFSKFYVKFGLFCFMIFLAALLIDFNTSKVRLPILGKDEFQLEEETFEKDEYLIYVADMNHLIFPLSITTNTPNETNIPIYEDQINSETDELVYMTFALLTNYSNYLPKGVKTIIPPSTRLVSYEIKDDMLILNVSSEFLHYNKALENKLLSILTYTYVSVLDVSKVKLLCDNKEIDFVSSQKETFSKDDFVLNVYYKTSDTTNYSLFVVYYYASIEETHYLVQTTIVDTLKDETKEDKLKELITNHFNIPLITFVSKDDLLLIQHNVGMDTKTYYQYYFTFLENELSIEDEAIEIADINNYEIVFSW